MKPEYKSSASSLLHFRPASHLGKWAASLATFLPPTINEAWSRRGRVLGIMGIGVSALVLLRMKERLLGKSFHMFASSSAETNSVESGAPKQVVAVGTSKDLGSFESELSDKDRALIRFGSATQISLSGQLPTRPHSAAEPFDFGIYFHHLRAKSVGRVVLYSPLLDSTQTTLYSALETERSGLVCLADRSTPVCKHLSAPSPESESHRSPTIPGSRELLR
jgi:hypothetical protein